MEPMRLADLFDRYVTLRNLDAKTIALYGQLLDRLRAHLGHEPTVADLDDLVVSRYLRERATHKWRGKPISAASVAKDRHMLAAVWTMAARKRLAAEFPELPRIKVPKRLPTGRAYTAADVSAMLRRASTRHGTTGGVPSAWWWTTLLWTAYCTGERATALLSLRWGDVDTARQAVVFRGACRKGKTRDIERGIVSGLAAMLAARAGRPEDLVWVWDRHRASLWTSLKVLCRLAGVKYRGFHGLRRTRASYAALAGGREAATAILDHSDPRLQEVYVDPAICPSTAGSVDCLPPVDWQTDAGEPGTVVLD
ncbi:MAG: tyrosine-type recombinase/integrase [Planctomycetes bacterium]|nr:tyrosine-type recombinase/integrase [Planctomycetota bacterium]